MNLSNAPHSLNYKHLRYFWMVAKTGSVAKAAEQLYLTPQSISGQLTEFSRLLGVELFRRAGRNLELTVGLFVAPTTIALDVCKQYSVKVVGHIDSVLEQIFVISTERRLTHPAVKAVSQIGRNDVFGK